MERTGIGIVPGFNRWMQGLLRALLVILVLGIVLLLRHPTASKAGAAISGTALAEGRSGTEHVVVTLSGPAGPWEVYPGVAGDFALGEVADGQYVLQAARPGHFGAGIFPGRVEGVLTAQSRAW